MLIPAYNEQNRIHQCLERIAPFLSQTHPSSEIVISEDGSKDRTVEIVNTFKQQYNGKVPITLLHSDTRLGKVGGLRKGIEVAKGSYTIFTDTDLPVPLEAFTQAVELLKNGADVVAGSRVIKGATRNEPLNRRFLSHCFHYLARILLGIRWDSQCGFKVVRTAIGKEAFAKVTNSGFAYDVEFLIQVQRLGAKIVEMPVQWHYSPDSSMKLRREVVGMFRELLEIFVRTKLAGIK